MHFLNVHSCYCLVLVVVVTLSESFKSSLGLQVRNITGSRHNAPFLVVDEEIISVCRYLPIYGNRVVVLCTRVQFNETCFVPAR